MPSRRARRKSSAICTKRKYETATRGERKRQPARAAGEGVYQLVRSGRETYLAYKLELPRQPGEVQCRPR